MSKLRRDERERLVRMFTGPTCEGPMYHSQHLMIRDRLVERRLVKHVREEILIAGAWKRQWYEITNNGRHAVRQWRKRFRESGHPKFESTRTVLP